MKNNLTIKTLQKISDVYNDLNIDWLLTGEGEMLLGTATHVNPVANNAVDVSAIVRGFLTEIAAQREHYEKIIAVQRAHYERLITEIAKSQDVRKNIVGGALSARV
ncbi:MAG: hypothetical protein LBK94_06465 [Prevotellaceae bacterium]|nr:hypothetical protein [Prevotellaceae bacterium]